MQILTSAEMAEADRRSVAEFGIPMSRLMDAAGGAVARFCLRRYPAAGRVVALCGKGNNGGDGFVAARVLAEAGRQVTVVLAGLRADVKGEAARALALLAGVGVEVLELAGDGVTGGGAALIGEAELVLDALVGTGFKPPLRGVAAGLQGLLAGMQVPVVAVDLPSGWDADSMAQTAEGSVRADAVVTFTEPKMAHVFGHLTSSTSGPVVVAEIGSPDAAVVSQSGLRWAGAAKAVAERPREVNSNKGKFGHVLVVGGSYGTAGAPAMASLAAMRAGAGLVTAVVPEVVAGTVAGIAPELMVRPLWQGAAAMREPAFGVPSLANLEPERMSELLKGISVLAVGPGLSTREGAGEFARELIARTPGLPVVIDADALNAFEGKAGLLDGAGRVMVLTPHPGEMARLAGLTVKQVEADRPGLARRFAVEHKLTLVLKGWRTLIAHPDGTVAVNTSGNPAMAKGGSGDILTGIIAAMLAQYASGGAAEDVARAVEAAVYLHGLAADFAAVAQDEHTVLATDTVGHLSDAFRYRVADEDGLVWVCGMRG